MKYPINKEFSPYSRFAPPIQNAEMAGIPVTLNETKGTMHGFDIVERAPTKKASVLARIKYMKSRL